MKFKEILLLLLIIAVGVTFYHAQTGKIHIDWNWDNWEWEDGVLFIYEAYTYEETEEIQTPFPPIFQVINDHGDVEIEGTSKENITITLTKKIRRKNQEQAGEVADELKMVIEKDDQQIRLSTNREDFSRRNFNTNFLISVPKGTAVSVDNSHGLVRVSNTGKTDIINPYGKVTVADVSGDLSIQNKHRNIDIENVDGACKIESRYATVTAVGVSGNVEITHRHGKVHLENLSQGAVVDGTYNEVLGQDIEGLTNISTSSRKVALYDVGPVIVKGYRSRIVVDGAEGPIQIEDRYGSVSLDNIQGDVTINGKSLTVNGSTVVADNISITTSYRDVDLMDFSGKTNIDLSNGNVTLTPSPLTHTIEVKGKYSDIKFFWPVGEKYPIEARTTGGDIRWGLTDEEAFRDENGFSVLKAFVGEVEKPAITLSTTYGSIRIVGESAEN
jgi:hypothetical protein